MPTCAKCGNQMLRVSGTDRYSCLSGCPELDLRPPQNRSAADERALKLPGLDRGRQSVKIKQPEKEVQQQIVTALKARGYIVLETSEARRRVQCPPQLTEAETRRGERPGCGKWFYPIGGRSGLSRGLSDILVRNPAWPRWLFASLEIKGGNTASREEQIKLAQDGHVRIVWSLADALAAIDEVNQALLGENG